MLRGLPVPDADRLMYVDERIDRLAIDQNGTPLHDYLDLVERQTVFEELGAYTWASFNLAGDEGPLRHKLWPFQSTGPDRPIRRFDGGPGDRLRPW